MLINSIKKIQQLVHHKFQPYLNRFICCFVFNSLQCFIAKHNLEITYCEAITEIAYKKPTKKVAQKKRLLQSKIYIQKL